MGEIEKALEAVRRRKVTACLLFSPKREAEHCQSFRSPAILGLGYRRIIYLFIFLPLRKSWGIGVAGQ